MEQKKLTPNLYCDVRLNPQSRLCSRFDMDSIARFPIARPGETGFRVVDNFAEEHMM